MRRDGMTSAAASNEKVTAGDTIDWEKRLRYVPMPC